MAGGESLPEAFQDIYRDWRYEVLPRFDSALVERWREVKKVPGAGLVVLYDLSEETRRRQHLEPDELPGAVLWSDGVAGPMIAVKEDLSDEVDDFDDMDFERMRHRLPKKLDTEALQKARDDPRDGLWMHKYLYHQAKLGMQRALARAKAERGVVHEDGWAFWTDASELHVLLAKGPSEEPHEMETLTSDTPGQWVKLV